MSRCDIFLANQIVWNMWSQTIIQHLYHTFGPCIFVLFFRHFSDNIVNISSFSYSYTAPCLVAVGRYLEFRNVPHDLSHHDSLLPVFSV